MREVHLDSHLQSLRDAPQSHCAPPPQTQGDYYRRLLRACLGIGLLTGFGFQASFGPLPANSASTQTGLAPTPPDWECTP